MPQPGSTAERVSWVLSHCQTIAVVGLSPKPHRASFDVAQYMQSRGYRIIPINPNAREVLGALPRHERLCCGVLGTGALFRLTHSCRVLKRPPCVEAPHGSSDRAVAAQQQCGADHLAPLRAPARRARASWRGGASEGKEKG